MTVRLALQLSYYVYGSDFQHGATLRVIQKILFRVLGYQVHVNFLFINANHNDIRANHNVRLRLKKAISIKSQRHNYY